MTTLTQLEYIAAVDTYRHFGQAAEKCMVTQPTLSMQIKKMEEELNIKIFDRTKHPIVPTEIGALIIEQARHVLRESKKIELIPKQYYQEISGRLHIGILPTISPYLLPLVIGKIRKQHPGIQLHIKELTTSEMIEGLNKDQLDVGILSTPLHEENIQESVLFYEEIKVYTHFNHPLRLKNSLNPQDIAERQDMWMLTDGNCFKDQVVNFCNRFLSQEHKEQIKYESGSIETLKKLVDTEGGFTFIPELAALELPVRHLNRILSFDSPPPIREISLCYIRNHSKKDLLEILHNHICNSIPEEMLLKSRGTIVEWK